MLEFDVESNVAEESIPTLKAEFVEDTGTGEYILRPHGRVPKWLRGYIGVDTDVSGTFLVNQDIEAFVKHLFVGDMDYVLHPKNESARLLEGWRVRLEPRP